MKVIAAEAKTASIGDYLQLTKPRITFMVVLTTALGFFLANQGETDILLLFNTLVGTALVASGASALNMVMEWEVDSRMRRTENRPIPSGRLTVLQSISFGTIVSVLGIFQLLFFVNFLTSMLATLTLALYLFAYTPLKRRTSLCTLVGAVPGAIPPMMGWTAVTNSVDFKAWWLFAVLFLWQLPHFLAIAWLYREDYARGGFPMLPVTDPEGSRTSRQIIFDTVALLAVSMLPGVLGMAGRGYFWGALLLGSVFLTMGIRLAMNRSNTAARTLLLTSVIYLPLLLTLMVLDKAI